MTLIRMFREYDGGGSASFDLFTKEQREYVDSISDTALRSHLLHQVRLRDNIEKDRDSFEKQISSNYNKAIDKVIEAVKDYYDRVQSICPETLIPELQSLKQPVKI